MAPFNGLLMEQDRIIAKALAEFRLLGRLVTKHSRQDDIRFFQTVMEEGSHYLSPHQSRDLWKVIKRALPKYRQRRVAVDPLRMMALEDEWNPHFEALEAGCIVETERLLAEVACPLQQVDEHNAPTIADLPTLFELEHTLRANRTGRATGHDPLSSALFHNHAAALAEHAFPLMMKMWIWGEEPIQYKGGPMALIPKVPQPVEVKHYRGILLLPTVSEELPRLAQEESHPTSGSSQTAGTTWGICRPRSLVWVPSIESSRQNGTCKRPQHWSAICGLEHSISLSDKGNGCGHC